MEHAFQTQTQCGVSPAPKLGFLSKTVWVGMQLICLSVCLVLSSLSPAPSTRASAFVRRSVLVGLLFMSSTWCTRPLPNVGGGGNFLTRVACCSSRQECVAKFENLNHRSASFLLKTIPIIWLLFVLIDAQRVFCLSEKTDQPRRSWAYFNLAPFYLYSR